jgi:hypothetical protein
VDLSISPLPRLFPDRSIERPSVSPGLVEPHFPNDDW